ncbi:MAG: DUF1573 domain-containing protein [Chthoniobacterales bacterium]
MNSKLTTFFAAVFLGTCLSAHAELKWEKTMIELHPKSTDAEAVANFKYENKGKTPIKIKSVKTSCGCTVATLKKDEVAPGESGEVTATFHVAGRTGTQEKAITVETDDASQPLMTLTLKAVIEQPIEIQPTFVFWQAGEAPTAKTIAVKVGKDVKVTKIDVTTSSPAFAAHVEKMGASDYKISIAPESTAHTADATVTIKTDLPQPYFVSARVIAQPGVAR